MSLRFRLAGVLERLGVLETALRTRGMLELPLLTAVTYHRIGYPGEGELDGDVVDATPEELDEQVAMLAARFSLIGVDELVAYFSGGAALPPNPALITFDDGYRDCVTRALPILRRHGARAVFFVATGFPAQNRLYWWDKIALLVRRSKRPRLQLSYPLPIDVDMGDAERALLRVVKGYCGLDFERFFEEVGAALGASLSADEEAEVASRLLMSWDEIRELHRAGMDVESHTRTHRVIHTVPEAELADELEGSRRELEAQLDAPVRAIAYPVGRPLSDTPALTQAARRAGYAVGFSNCTGLTLLRGRTDPFDLRRIAVDRAAPSSYLLAAVSLPLFAHEAPASHLVSLNPPQPSTPPLPKGSTSWLFRQSSLPSPPSSRRWCPRGGGCSIGAPTASPSSAPSGCSPGGASSGRSTAGRCGWSPSATARGWSASRRSWPAAAGIRRASRSAGSSCSALVRPRRTRSARSTSA